MHLGLYPGPEGALSGIICGRVKAVLGSIRVPFQKVRLQVPFPGVRHSSLNTWLLRNKTSRAKLLWSTVFQCRRCQRLDIQ